MRYLLRGGLVDTVLLVVVAACASCSFRQASNLSAGGASSSGASGGTGSGGTEAGSGRGGSGSGGKGGSSGGSKSGGGKGGTGSGKGGGPNGQGGDSGSGGESDPGGSSGSGAMPSTAIEGLWYAGEALCAFAPEQLERSDASDPALIMPIPGLTAVSDVALDASGNAWVAGTGSNSVFRFPAVSLNDPESAVPDLELTHSELENPGNLALDDQGHLWVATRPPVVEGRITEGSLLRFDIPDDASGTLDLPPAADLRSAIAGDLDLIGTITFDADQNLWVSSLVGLLRFDDPTELSGVQAVQPGAVIEKSGYANNIHFYSVAFDHDGALWSASGDGLHYLTSVTKFDDPGSLEGRSSPDAAVSILGGADLLPAGGLAFDTSGNLWMATSYALFNYADLDSLSGPVDPSPAITLEVSGPASPTTNSHLLFIPPTDEP